ncbi:hypothetical protein [Kitasatospora phosalacinea]|uniref:Translation initiation factor 2 n=1 Tax=Kitasatospora phosalacinea TaxID=2065 RepID=A0ABW6GLW8_9ACTN
MDFDRRILVPVGPDAWRWRTFGSERTVAVAARTVTSLVRVLEVLPDLVGDDPRLTVVFAHDPTSAFGEGVPELLRSLRCRTLPWDQLGEAKPDLMVSASENIGVPVGDYPVLVLPHGVGFQKFVPDSASSGTRLSGLVSDGLLTARRAWLAVSHPDQERQLAAAHPATVGRTVLVGDPCLDRLHAGLRWRERYRSSLGVEPGQRLVFLSSTWGPGSLIGRCPDLPARLLAALPSDEYRLALVLHPNVWSGHGAWQVRVVERAALAAGALLIDPTEGWQQALTASDVVVGDHGSVTLYGAALGKPVLLAAFGEEAVPGTAGHLLHRSVPLLDRSAPLRPQIDAALSGHRSELLTAVTTHAFAEQGSAFPKLRQLLYQLLELDPPPGTNGRPRAFPPVPRSGAGPATSFYVETALASSDASPFRVSVRRYPASVSEPGEEADNVFWHLASDAEEPDTHLTDSASVLVCQRPSASSDSAHRRIAGLRAHYTALLVAVPLPDGVLVDLLDGPRFAVRPADGALLAPGPAAAAFYSVLRVKLRPELLDHSGLLLDLGSHCRELTVQKVPEPH